MTASDLDQLVAHVRYRLGPRVDYARPWRVDELTRLVIRCWPHGHLEAAAGLGGRNHKAVDHAMALCKALVRERWEAKHDVGPLWAIVLGSTVTGICEVLGDLWWADKNWRTTLREMSARAKE